MCERIIVGDCEKQRIAGDASFHLDVRFANDAGVLIILFANVRTEIRPAASDRIESCGRSLDVTSGAFSADAKSVLKWAITSFGVPAGASTPSQPEASKFLYLDSANPA